MLEKLNKNYWPFFVAIGLFIVIIISSFSLYLSWNNDVEADLSVEVTLPIIDLGGYYNLSKQLDSDTK
jgi:hypothetical protein